MVLCALAWAPAAHAGGPALLLGTAEDDVKGPTLVAANTNMRLARLAGHQAVRMTALWGPGKTASTALERKLLGNAASAARLNGMTVFLAVHNVGSRFTPLTEEARTEFARYAASLARSFPTFRNIIVGNEPNINRFWMPQYNLDGSDAAAPGYLALLAKTYDALKAVSRRVTVIGGALSPRGADNPSSSRHTHSPTTFITDLGDAYRESGRTKPIMDQFAIHPYQDNSSQPPSFRHPNTRTISISDYPKLVGLLGRAFNGTGQAGSTLPIVYAEYGVESVVPASKARRYTGKELATVKPVSAETQGAYYRQAIQIAFCQPNVRAMLLFLTFDDKNLAGWQSGAYYVDRTPKSNLGTIRRATEESRRGVVNRCEGLELDVEAKVRFPLAADLRPGRQPVLRLQCDIDCDYVLRLEKLPRRSVTQVLRGRAIGGQKATRVELPPLRLAPGIYRYALQLVAAVNRGEPKIIASRPLRVTRSPT